MNVTTTASFCSLRVHVPTHPGRESGVERRAPVPVADEQLVEGGQEVRRGPRAGPGGRRGGSPEDTARDGVADELRARELERLARVRGGESRPPREILERRGAVPGEVACRELRERLRRREPLVKESERLLLPVARREADELLLREAREDVYPALAIRGDPFLAEHAVERVAPEAAPAIERPRDGIAARSKRRVVEPKLAVPGHA